MENLPGDQDYHRPLGQWSSGLAVNFGHLTEQITMTIIYTEFYLYTYWKKNIYFSTLHTKYILVICQ